MNLVNIPIDMIVQTDKKGNNTPLKIKVTDEGGDEQVIKIEKVIVREKEKVNRQYFLKYTCQAIINGAMRTLEITYCLDDCIWRLYRLS